MTSSDILISALKQFEGCRLTSYRCPAGVLTIGVGHTYGVKPGQKITMAQAESLLRGDLLKFEREVSALGLGTLTQGQFDALVDFCFNCGTANLKSSTLLKKIRAHASESEIRYQFSRWNKASGKELPGLTKRRKWEADRFFS